MHSYPDPRKTLVETALRLFASRGYYHTSIADILRESGCTRGTLYYYFSSKEELGYAAIDEWIRYLREEGPASHPATKDHPCDRLLGVIGGLPKGFKTESSSTTVADITARMASVHEGFRKHLAERLDEQIQRTERMLRKAVADGQIADSVDPRQLAHVVAIISYGIQTAGLLGHPAVMWEDTKRWLRDYLNSLRR